MFDLKNNPDFINSDNGYVTSNYYDLSTEKYSSNIEVYGKNAIDQAIENILCTEPAERLFNLSFFSPVYQMLFENYSNSVDYVDEIFDAIEAWVPVQIDRTNAEIFNDNNNHAVQFQIPYVSNDGKIYGVFKRIISK